MLSNASEFNQVGGGFGGGFGGFGGIAPIGLIGINNLFDRDRRGGGDDDNCGKNIALLAAINNAKDQSVAEARALGAAVCESEKTNLQQFYAQAIQASALQNQTSAQAVAERPCESWPKH